VITCGHTFCHFCILEWTTQYHNCQICLKEIPNCCYSELHKHVQIDNFIAKMYNALGGNYLLTRLQLQNARAEQRCTPSSSFPREPSKQSHVTQKPPISNHAPVRNRDFSSRTDHFSPSQPISIRSQQTPASDSSISSSNHPRHPPRNYTVVGAIDWLIKWISRLSVILSLIAAVCGSLDACLTWYKRRTGQYRWHWGLNIPR
jgi:hypothetical protein